MKYLADNKYNIISCKEGVDYLIRNRTIPPRTAVITFDDGYKNNYVNAVPVLEKYNFPATIFLTADFLSDYSGDKRYLSLPEIKDMQKCRLIDFGCHGLTHKALTMLDADGLDKEIKVAKQKLEDALGNKRNERMQQPEYLVESESKDVLSRGPAVGILHSGFDPFEIPVAQIVPEKSVNGA